MALHCFLSPHLDDAVYSCGAWIAQLVSRGERVLVLTLCAGDPPPGPLSPFALALHVRWEVGRDGVARRREEDRKACAHLGAQWRHLDLPEAIYRKDGERFLYASEEAIFGPLDPADLGEARGLRAAIQEASQGARLYAPLAVGGHVDHRLARLILEGLGVPMGYYPDLPYALRGYALPRDLPLPSGRWQVETIAAPARERWLQAVWMYASQRSTFWESRGEMEAELRGALHSAGGMKWFEAVGA